jgi:hypothetical protein
MGPQIAQISQMRARDDQLLSLRNRHNLRMNHLVRFRGETYIGLRNIVWDVESDKSHSPGLEAQA